MNKTLCAAFSLVALLAVGCSTTQSTTTNAQPLLKQTQKPNVIFILVDDMGYGELGSFGQTIIKTPHLDQMANDIVFYHLLLNLADDF